MSSCASSNLSFLPFQVMLADACRLLRVSAKHLHGVQSVVHQDFAEEARKNLATLANLRWQYFGSITGEYVIYPGICIGDDYDFRTR